MATTNTDFRLQVGYFEHFKIQKLAKKCGDHGVLSHLRLLRFVSQNKPDGVLTGMDHDDIEIAAGYQGDADFVKILIDLRLIDETDDDLVIHDWAENNPYAYGASERSDHGRYNAILRHHGKEAADHWRETGELPKPTKKPRKTSKRRSGDDEGQGETTSIANSNDANSMQNACVAQCAQQDTALHTAMLVDAMRNAPSPYPIPSPVPYPSPSPIPVPSPEESVIVGSARQAPEAPSPQPPQMPATLAEARALREAGVNLTSPHALLTLGQPPSQPPPRLGNMGGSASSLGSQWAQVREARSSGGRNVN